ncbi:NAD(P)-dependent oxidoreductase [Pelagibacteraceae bacterium]|nr:NAD(P)-dependent oxidoreductase [Pelagibacteraceae bacterium]
MKKENIGFIGLGNVGKKLANNLINKKNKIFLYDKNPKTYFYFKNKNVFLCKSFKDLVINSNIIITCLPSPVVVNNVINSLIPYISSSHLWIEMSTTDKDEMIRLSKIFKKKGGNVLECPITGGEHRATSGNISILAAGERKVFNRAFPVLSKMGHQILYCGKIGNASILKIITNYLASLNLLGIGEALAVSKKNNINLGLTHKAINISSGNSFVNETETKVILSGSYDVGFTMDLVNKDIGLFNKLANQHNLQIDLGKILQKKFKKGLKEFGSRSFSTSIVKLIEDQGRIKMRAKNFPKELIDNFSKQKGIEV